MLKIPNPAILHCRLLFATLNAPVFHGVTDASYKSVRFGLTIGESQGKIAMGEEIAKGHFQKQDFREFQDRLQQETALLRTWFDEGVFDGGHLTGGFEIEAWLIDRAFDPAPVNQAFLEMLDNPMVVPELSAFNVELNTTPRLMTGSSLARMQLELEQTWALCRQTADKLDADLLMIGILPTVHEELLALNNMSMLTRYRALNEQILRLRKGEAIELDISGRELLNTKHQDVMLEAAATSFQIHLKVPPELARRYYNASIILSAPMVAISANSPYLFGKDLWDETRIPLFEQAVSVASARTRQADRVTFGKSFINQTLMECFDDNLAAYAVLLPELMNSDVSRLNHLRLHNGTIWRWNRPLIGFNDDGTPHLRIEHRVVPAGPSAIDTIANAAFYYGLVHAMAQAEKEAENLISFETARSNFYAAAKNSLNANITWLDNNSMPIHSVLVDILLPMAREGLQMQDFSADDIERYLGVIEGRLHARCNGAAWQRSWVAINGNDMHGLTRAYAKCQQTGEPVHEWKIEKEG